MASLSNYLMLLAFVLATIIATISAEETLSQCGEHIGAYCGEQVIQRLKGTDETTMSTTCCYKLLQTGYPCHTRHTIYILENNPELKHANWTELFAKSDKIYHNCDVLTKPGTAEFVATCTENLGSECGIQVYNNLIHDKNITKDCCERLVKTGEACHVAMTKSLIRNPEMRNVDAIQLLNKNTQLFNYCLHV
ncbi:hypothetical protein VNO78_06434 [Psophocarpus tetragonolobus]|uniref:Prolamin-like domain-containing protein n=1 Tax=Psophocarpus tetragonolobus TaxID=3891 RepID=A0AAN9XRE5_PSOTE